MEAWMEIVLCRNTETYLLTQRKKRICVFCFKKIPKLALCSTFPHPLLKDWILCYHSFSNDKVFSSILRLSWDRAAWEVSQSRIRICPPLIFLLTGMQLDNLFLKIWSLLVWYLFWFLWRVQLCCRKTCGWKTFTINYFYAHHMYQEQQRRSPLWGIFQRDDPCPFLLTSSEILALELHGPLPQLQNYYVEHPSQIWKSLRVGDKIPPCNNFAKPKNESQHLAFAIKDLPRLVASKKELVSASCNSFQIWKCILSLVNNIISKEGDLNLRFLPPIPVLGKSHFTSWVGGSSSPSFSRAMKR